MSKPLTAEEFPLYWAKLINDGRLEDVISLYHENIVLMPTFSPKTIRDEAGVRDYFVQLAARKGLNVKLHENTVNSVSMGNDKFAVNGIYSFEFELEGAMLSFPARFTFVIDLTDEHPIAHHHSSQIPRTLS